MKDSELATALRQHAADSESTDLFNVAAARLYTLNVLCSELYQVIGVLAYKANVFDRDAVEKALDNAHAGAEGKAIPHTDLLPFDVDG